MEEFEYNQLRPDAKKLFEDLKIPKTDQNATIFGNFMKGKSIEYANMIIETIKEEYTE